MENIQIIEDFYEAFKSLNSKTMNSFLANDINFEDPAFGELNGEDVKYMWQFLCENAQDFSLSFSDIETLDSQTVKAKWQAKYTFTATGNLVINNVNSVFKLKNGKIKNHQDDFDIKIWARQALGKAVGVFGPSFLLKKAIQKQSKKQLKKYIKYNNLL